MRKRFLTILLALTLTVAMVPEAFAVDSGSITDISGHWAEDAIRGALEGDVFKGVSETSFQPNTPMTRGMFVTVLGRLAGVAPEDYSDTYALFQDVPANSYYAPYITWGRALWHCQGHWRRRVFSQCSGDPGAGGHLRGCAMRRFIIMRW